MTYHIDALSRLSIPPQNDGSHGRAFKILYRMADELGDVIVKRKFPCPVSHLAHKRIIAAEVPIDINYPPNVGIIAFNGPVLLI